MRLFLDPAFFTPRSPTQRDSVIAFARYCLPQVFFYGMFVLVGQVLNARGRFGPMMWAPIANNVVSVAVLRPTCSPSARPRGAEAGRLQPPAPSCCSGLGSTLGIAVQFLVLLPYLRRPGSASGRGSTSAAPGSATRCGWACGRCCSSWSTRSPTRSSCASPAAAPSTAHRRRPRGHRLHDLLQLVPADDGAALDHHRLAGHRDAAAALVVRRRLRPARRWHARWPSTLRSAYALVVPVARSCALMALDLANIIWGYGSARRRLRQLRPVAGALRARAGAVHHPLPDAARLLRPGAEPRVFLIQCVIAATNIVAAVLLTRGRPGGGDRAAPGDRLRRSYAVGAVALLHPAPPRVGGLEGARWSASWSGC